MTTTISNILQQFYNLKQIYQRIIKSHNNAKISLFKNCTITGRGIKTLQGSECFNDEVINAYFQSISDSSKLRKKIVDSQNFKTTKS